jgi:hypothetical protein
MSNRLKARPPHRLLSLTPSEALRRALALHSAFAETASSMSTHHSDHRRLLNLRRHASGAFSHMGQGSQPWYESFGYS